MAVEPDVVTSISYWAEANAPDLSEALAMLNGTHPGIQKCSTQMQDLRGLAFEPSIDDHAFRIIKHGSALLPPSKHDFDFSDAQKVRDYYWPELQSMLKSELGARCALPLESVTRMSTEDPHVLFPRKHDQDPIIGESRISRTSGKPFHIAHNDFSPVGSRNLLRAVKPSFFEDNGISDSLPVSEQQDFFKLRNEILEAERTAMDACGVSDHTQWDGTNYDGPRWAHFSIWRPLETVQKDPLGLLDPSSLFTVPSTHAEKLKSYISIAFPHKDRKGLNDYIGANIMPRPPPSGQEYKWYWLKEQRSDEVFVVKFFDSEAWMEGSTVMPCCAHSAFEIPGQEMKPPMQSIETRCLVIW